MHLERRLFVDFFDLHCDTITTAMHYSCDLTEKNLDISFPLNPKIKKHCQCFAIFCPDKISNEDAFNYYTMAKHYFHEELNICSQYLVQVFEAKDIKRIVDNGKTAAILTVEGARVLNGKIELLETLRKDGVKMLTLTWNGENELGCGSMDQGFGLKQFGIDVIKSMEKIGMIIDVSHLSNKGFEDVVNTVSCPIVASHSNLYEVCSNRRNLKNEYFKEIVHRGGLVGINFYKNFLNDDGDKASVNDILKHIDYMLTLGGENNIALGSDYDGCDVVKGIEKLNDILALYDLINKEFGEIIARKIFWENANDFFVKRI